MTNTERTTQLHKAEAADSRLSQSTCLVCGDDVTATIGASGKVFAHSDGHIASSRPALSR